MICKSADVYIYLFSVSVHSQIVYTKEKLPLNYHLDLNVRFGSCAWGINLSFKRKEISHNNCIILIDWAWLVIRKLNASNHN